MRRVQIAVTLRVDTALSVGAGGSSGVLASKAIVRNQLGQLVLPGSHLKGRLRHACEIIARAAGHGVCESPRPELMCPQLVDREYDPVPAPCPICQIFGSSWIGGAVEFGDLVYGDAQGGDLVRPPTVRPGASVNRRRKTVEEQRLFFTETSPVGGDTYFDNPDAIVGWLAEERAEEQVRLLLSGLRLVQSWGGGKSRGLGWGSILWQASLDDEPVALVDVKASIERLGEFYG